MSLWPYGIKKNEWARRWHFQNIITFWESLWKNHFLNYGWSKKSFWIFVLIVVRDACEPVVHFAHPCIGGWLFAWIPELISGSKNKHSFWAHQNWPVFITISLIGDFIFVEKLMMHLGQGRCTNTISHVCTQRLVIIVFSIDYPPGNQIVV